MRPAASSVSGGTPRRYPAAVQAAHALALGASPVFALAAWITAGHAPHAHGSMSSGSLPFDGMTTMYLLMSLFHLPPWLKLASAAERAPNP